MMLNLEDFMDANHHSLYYSYVAKMFRIALWNATKDHVRLVFVDRAGKS